MRRLTVTIIYACVFLGACAQEQAISEGKRAVICNLRYHSGFEKGYKFSPFNEINRIVKEMQDSGIVPVAYDDWHARYKSDGLIGETIIKEENVWNLCDQERNIFIDTLETIIVYSCVFKRESMDTKLIYFYYKNEEMLEKDLGKLKQISKYILCTRGLKQPNRLIYIDNRAFILQTRAVMYGDLMHELKRIIENHDFNPPNSYPRFSIN